MSGLPIEKARGLECSETDAWMDLYRAASPDVARACGIRVSTVGGAGIAIAAGVDVLAFNRAIGLGVTGPASEEMLDEIVDLYAAANVPRFFVQLAPAAGPAALPEWLLSRGFRHYNNWVKLYRGVEPPAEVETDLRIEEINGRDADQFAAIVVSSFGWPEPVRPWLSRIVGRRGWRHYLAFDGGKPVATGSLFARDGWCWKDFAATLPDYRRRGAQQALLARGIRDAAALGCSIVVVETAEDTPDRPSSSYRNVVRSGFRVAYSRPSYLYERPQS